MMVHANFFVSFKLFHRRGTNKYVCNFYHNKNHTRWLTVGTSLFLFRLMYRNNQYTVYKQLTRFMKQMIYWTGWRPTVQSSPPSWVFVLKTPTKWFDRFSVSSRGHILYWENWFSHGKQKTSKGSHNLHNSSLQIPYMVPNRSTFTAEDTTVQ